MQSFVIGAATPNYYWRDYFPGEIPYDAVEGCAGRYIGQVHHIHGDLVATIYPQSETAVAEIEDTGRIIYTKNIRVSQIRLIRWIISVKQSGLMMLLKLFLSRYSAPQHLTYFDGKRLMYLNRLKVK